MKNVKGRLWLIWIIICVLKSNALTAQRFSLINYTTKEGIAAPTVYGIAQDKDGFMWFGTECGISRFDGVRFKNYTMSDGLPNNEVFNIYADSKNRIWIICFKNAVCYYQNGKIHNQENDTVIRKVRLKHLLSDIAEDSSGNILFSTATEVILLSNDNHVRQLKSPEDLNTFYPQTGVGHLPLVQFLSPAQLSHPFDSMSDMLLQTRIPDRGPKQYEFYSHRYRPVSKGILTRKGSTENYSVIQLPHETRYVTAVNATLYAFISRNKGAVLFYADSSLPARRYLGQYPVNYVFEDIEHNLWFSTKGHGVFKMGNNRFRNYSTGGLGVRNIQQHGQNIYIGTDNDNYWKLPALTDGSFRQDEGEALVKVRGYFDRVVSGIGNSYINCAGSDFLPLHRYFPDLLGAVKTIQILNDTLLIATSHNCVTALFRERHFLDTVFRGRTTCAYRQRGICYIGTVNGLYQVQQGKTIFLGDKHPVLNCQVSQIAAGTDGTLWISTYEKGVVGYKNDRIVAIINEENGLSSNITRCLSVSDSVLWIGTSNGLNKVYLNEPQPVVGQKITEADGLNADIINAIYTAGPYIYVGTSLGLTVFDERRLTRHAFCNLKLTKVIVSGHEQDLLQGPLLLSPAENNIRFEFSGLSFSSGRDITYRYRLKGLNDEWQLTREAFLSYPSLPSGSYCLQIEAINKFGDKSALSAFPFSIQPAVTERWWFRLMLFITVVLVTVLVVGWLIRRSHAREREKLLTSHKLMELEQMALRAQMNPHFIFNCLNSMQRHIVNQDVKTANFYLSRFSGLIRQTLDNSSKAYIPLSEEIAYLTNYLELERLQLSEIFTYRIVAGPSLDQAAIMIPNMVLQPYIENAIKHGVSQLAADGHIRISFSLNKDHDVLTCIIEDNGPGITQSRKIASSGSRTHASYGMSLTEKRVVTINQLSDHGKDILVNVEDLGTLSQPGLQGTRVTVAFPV